MEHRLSAAPLLLASAIPRSPLLPRPSPPARRSGCPLPSAALPVGDVRLPLCIARHVGRHLEAGSAHAGLGGSDVRQSAGGHWDGRCRAGKVGMCGVSNGGYARVCWCLQCVHLCTNTSVVARCAKCHMYLYEPASVCLAVCGLPPSDLLFPSVLVGSRSECSACGGLCFRLASQPSCHCHCYPDSPDDPAGLAPSLPPSVLLFTLQPHCCIAPSSLDVPLRYRAVPLPR